MGSSLATALTKTIQSRPQCRENSTVTGISSRFRPTRKRFPARSRLLLLRLGRLLGAPVRASVSVSTSEVRIDPPRPSSPPDARSRGAAGANDGHRASCRFDYMSGRLCRREPTTSGRRPERAPETAGSPTRRLPDPTRATLSPSLAQCWPRRSVSRIFGRQRPRTARRATRDRTLSELHDWRID